jgi:hypothetical protein
MKGLEIVILICFGVACLTAITKRDKKDLIFLAICFVLGLYFKNNPEQLAVIGAKLSDLLKNLIDTIVIIVQDISKEVKK